MGAVILSISPTAAATTNPLTGNKDIADVLSGGDTGFDLGQASNGVYAPLSGPQSENGGSKDLYFSHNADVDPITNVGFYLAEFTGTYGGPGTISDDYNAFISEGQQDNGSTANNADGLSAGLHMDMAWQIGSSSAEDKAGQFSPARVTTGQKRIFGKSIALVQYGIQEHPIGLHEDACFYWDGSTSSDASAPVAGKIGKSTDTVLGNRARIRLRYMLRTAASIGGILQANFVTLFSYTA